MSHGKMPSGYDFAAPNADLVGYWRAYVPNVGTFYIRRMDNHWHAMFGSESLGSYGNPAAALQALVSGHTAKPESGVDPSKHNLLRDLSQWPFYNGAAQLAPTKASQAGAIPGWTWHFVCDDERLSLKWIWRRMRSDGTIEKLSEPCIEFGRAVADAVENGFMPKRDAYVVIAGGTYTHFRPGQPPLTVPHDTRSAPLSIPADPDSRGAATLPDTDPDSTSSKPGKTRGS